jgi:hypothetical protein
MEAGELIAHANNVNVVLQMSLFGIHIKDRHIKTLTRGGILKD